MYIPYLSDSKTHFTFRNPENGKKRIFESGKYGDNLELDYHLRRYKYVKRIEYDCPRP